MILHIFKTVSLWDVSGFGVEVKKSNRDDYMSVDDVLALNPSAVISEGFLSDIYTQSDP